MTETSGSQDVSTKLVRIAKQANPAAISQKRADNAKDYLIAKGIAAGRLTTQAYGADWAKAATTKGASEPKNRRVQIWVK